MTNKKLHTIKELASSSKQFDQRPPFFNQMEHNVLQFGNRMVFDHLESVLKEIKDNFKTK